MKLKTITATKTTEPLLSMQARVLYRDRNGRTSDVTHQNIFGLGKLADDGALALHILSNFRNRLDLLFMAAEGRPSIDAAIVRLAIDDLRLDVEESSHLVSHVALLHELFSNSEALAPRQTPGARTAGRALSRTPAH